MGRRSPTLVRKDVDALSPVDETTELTQDVSIGVDERDDLGDDGAEAEGQEYDNESSDGTDEVAFDARATWRDLADDAADEGDDDDGEPLEFYTDEIRDAIEVMESRLKSVFSRGLVWSYKTSRSKMKCHGCSSTRTSMCKDVGVVPDELRASVGSFYFIRKCHECGADLISFRRLDKPLSRTESPVVAAQTGE